ncbi:selenide, water dikinase SelD [Pseudopelagicola sp. nBUS_20]|uniref:selenide, water dikinase SelD n=1 Tax=Pseudopelagicola sp. nBUS_20 TaxID=3395317 RepID=UPI003EBB84CD
MMLPTIQLSRDLVLVGGGHAHALLLRMWGMRPLAGVRVTLINPGPTAPYSGMLPGYLAGHYARNELDIDLVKLSRFAGVRLIMAPAEAINLERRTITVTGRGEIGYDVASIDIGIHAEMPDIMGFSEYAIGAKPLEKFANRWAKFLENVDAGHVDPDVAVIGGGVAGSEIALAMAHALRKVVSCPRIRVIEAGPHIIGRTRGAERFVLTAMAEHGVQPITGVGVKRIMKDSVVLEDGQHIPSQLTVGAAGAFAYGWLANSGLPLTDTGFIQVSETLQVEGQTALFAVGDCAHLHASPRPKAGVFAVRSAPVLYRNLRSALSGGNMVPFRPQKDYLKLISLGGKSAIAEKWGLALSSPVLWRWKDRIDQKFMDKFMVLPVMPKPKLPSEVALDAIPDVTLCGGCGSKVGPRTLSAVLQNLPRSGRMDVLMGPGDDAAVLQLGDTKQVVTTDHLRGFTEDFGLMARIATVHALGDIWAMGAKPQGALLSVTLPRMTVALQARSMSEILREVGSVLADIGAEIIGGHSSMGSELVIGLTITGLLDGSPVSHVGAKPGDVLILTRPIGSGTILAAEMRGEAQGDHVRDVLQEMAKPQGATAKILRSASAMSDVTGFGLAGHLMGICRASEVAAQIDLGAVPLYEGALSLAEAGYRSTIYSENAAAAPVLGAGCARGALLHDPQTSGGMLATIDANEVHRVLQSLQMVGHSAKVIGRIVDGPASITAS